jgi:endonuclease YncB( thermonuclease family)
MRNTATILLMLSIALTALSFDAKVISIIDGDTIHVLTANKRDVKIRLASIDAPERKQPFSTQSKQALSDKILGKMVEVKDHGNDKYGRIIADLYLDSRWINLEMIQDGFAWHYLAYSKDTHLADAEMLARKAKKGLWIDPNPIAPWEFR